MTDTEFELNLSGEFLLSFCEDRQLGAFCRFGTSRAVPVSISESALLPNSFLCPIIFEYLLWVNLSLCILKSSMNIYMNAISNIHTVKNTQGSKVYFETERKLTERKRR